MPTSPRTRVQRIIGRLRRLPVSARVGVGAGVVLAVIIGSAAAYGAGHPSSTTQTSPAAEAGTAQAVHLAAPNAPKKTRTPTPTPTPTPVITTAQVMETVSIPFQSTTVTSATLPQGSTSITTAGANGTETKTYTVTYTDGVETARALTSDTVTTPPVTQVTTVGTYVAPAAPVCTNGSYVNSAGNTVCSPEASSSAPSGATAKCVDGTYSFSQSRRGTCSSHGGVAAWL